LLNQNALIGYGQGVLLSGVSERRIPPADFFSGARTVSRLCCTFDDVE
ncbi:MAG: hypothetical protein ACJAYC_002512, partial [Halieaceae bacterium]